MDNNIYHSSIYHLKRHFSINSFQKYFLKASQTFQQLSKIIKNCELDNLHCRFNAWRLCLGVVDIRSSVQQKKNQIKQARSKYQQKKQEALKSTHKKSPLKQPTKKNPLLMMGAAKIVQSKQTESDQFLKQQIQKDVERTYQQMKFFQDKHILKLLSLILFIWCRRNPDVSYKQGMNQLLASVVVCYFKQAQFSTINQKPEVISQELWADHLFFNSVQHAQSDIYAVFEKIIQIQGDMYKTQADLSIKSKVNPNSKNNTPILQRIIQIKDHKLKHMDLQLFRIIKLQDVQTKSFMLRWIRCMHTREFDLQNSFTIWDSIFLEYQESDNSKKNKQFEFIDAMCLAMFMYMRSIVFTKQTAGQILQVYQKYPPLKRGQYLDELITLAWTICEQLRIQSQNNQASQSNWFQQSQKVQALHFMDKKVEKAQQKKPVQVQNKHHQPAKKSQPIEKQLKQAQNKKHHAVNSKHQQPGHNLHNKQTKAKQSTAHNEHHKQTHNESKNIKTTDPIKQNHIQKPINTQSHPKIEHNSSKQKVLVTQSQVQSSNNLNQIQQSKPTVVQKKIQPQSEKQTKIKNTQQNYLQSSKGNLVNVTIKLQSTQISQILQHLNQTLPLVRDIDAQSHIRKVIKKIQSKVKAAKQLQH